MSRFDSLDADYNGQQKAAKVTLLLTQGQGLTTSEVATMFGITYHGAYQLMNRLSGSIPLVKDETRNGCWYLDNT